MFVEQYALTLSQGSHVGSQWGHWPSQHGAMCRVLQEKGEGGDSCFPKQHVQSRPPNSGSQSQHFNIENHRILSKCWHSTAQLPYELRSHCLHSDSASVPAPAPALSPTTLTRTLVSPLSHSFLLLLSPAHPQTATGSVPVYIFSPAPIRRLPRCLPSLSVQQETAVCLSHQPPH